MKKKIFFVLLLLITVLGLMSLITLNQKQNIETNKLKIVTTLFPLYDFAKQIGQDKVEVTLLLPPGVEAHSYEPKPSDILKINDSDIFIYTGRFMEPWVEDIINGITNNDLKIIDSSEGINLIESIFHDEDVNEASMDPHIWLDFDNDIKIIKTISDAIIVKDIENKEFYKTQTEIFINKLSKLDLDYVTALSKCSESKIIYGGHFTFGYLSKKYNLEYLAAQGLSPDAEPTAKDLITLVNQVNDNKIEYIFYEELTSTKIAETISNETNAKMLLLNSAHNLSKLDIENNVSFVSIMEDNLINLKTGLKCNK